MPATQLEEIVGLEYHVIEFEERERRLPVQSLPDRLEPEHAVDGEVRAVIP